MNNPTEEVIDISFTESRDFRAVPATGVWGGATPQGEVLCNFFIEFQQHPESFKLHINKVTGKVEELSDAPSRKNFIRESQVAVMMRPDIARTIGEWLVKESDKLMFNPPGQYPKT